MNKQTFISIRNGLIAALAVIVFAIVVGRFFGYDANAVNGGSMHPTFKHGELVITKPADNLQVGDVIVFSYNGIRTIHRITAVEEDGYRTKGDAQGLDEEAQVVPSEAVLGKSWIRFPAIGGLWPTLMNITALQLVVVTALVLLLMLPDWRKVIAEYGSSGTKGSASRLSTRKNTVRTHNGRNALPRRNRP